MNNVAETLESFHRNIFPTMVLLSLVKITGTIWSTLTKSNVLQVLEHIITIPVLNEPSRLLCQSAVQCSCIVPFIGQTWKIPVYGLWQSVTLFIYGIMCQTPKQDFAPLMYLLRQGLSRANFLIFMFLGALRMYLKSQSQMVRNFLGGNHAHIVACILGYLQTTQAQFRWYWIQIQARSHHNFTSSLMTGLQPLRAMSRTYLILILKSGVKCLVTAHSNMSLMMLTSQKWMISSFTWRTRQRQQMPNLPATGSTKHLTIYDPLQHWLNRLFRCPTQPLHQLHLRPRVLLLSVGGRETVFRVKQPVPQCHYLWQILSLHRNHYQLNAQDHLNRSNCHQFCQNRLSQQLQRYQAIAFRPSRHLQESSQGSRLETELKLLTLIRQIL